LAWAQAQQTMASGLFLSYVLSLLTMGASIALT
jgi:hypothetical protein